MFQGRWVPTTLRRTPRFSVLSVIEFQSVRRYGTGLNLWTKAISFLAVINLVTSKSIWCPPPPRFKERFSDRGRLGLSLVERLFPLDLPVSQHHAKQRPYARPYQWCGPLGTSLYKITIILITHINRVITPVDVSVNCFYAFPAYPVNWEKSLSR